MLLVATLALGADIIATRMVERMLALGEGRDVVPGLLVLTHVRNTGAAYGLLTGQRWLLVLLAAAVMLLTPLLLRAMPRTGRSVWAGPVLTGLIVGGAAGNLLERSWRGYVTDYLQIPPVPLFQVFNLSDVAISIAITAITLLSLFGGEHTRRPGGGIRRGRANEHSLARADRDRREC